MSTPINNWPDLSNSANNYLLVNQITREIEKTYGDFFTADLTSGNVTLTDAQFRAAVVFRASGNTVARDLTVAAIKKLFVVQNTGSAVLSVKRGSATVLIQPGASALLYTDGTTNGLVSLGGAGGWDILRTPAIASGTLTLDLAEPAGFKVTLDQNVTNLVFTGAPSGKLITFSLEFVQDATGGRTVTWPGNLTADDGGSIPPPATASGASTVYTLQSSDGTNFKLFTGLDNGGTIGGNVTVNGNVTIGGAARRLLADFSNATTSDRLVIQPSTANQTCSIAAAPTGTGTTTLINTYNNSDINNASQVYFGVTATEARLVSGALGSGTFLPFSFYVNSGLRLQIETDGTTRPGADNTLNLGRAAFRWKEVFAGTGTINTSDGREKDVDPVDWKVRALTPAELECAKALSKEIGAYRFKAAIQEKGDHARMHIGMTVQRAIAIMEQYGLAPMAYGFICHDAWEAREEILDAEIERRPVLDENGDQVWVLIPNGEDLIRLPVIEEIEIQPERALVHPPGDLYGFRTDELLLFLAVGFEARLSALEGGV